MAKSLTPESLAKLLDAFSPDKAEAARAYENLRAALIRFFQLKGVSDCEQAADETIDRIPERIGETTAAEDINYIAFSIAKFVFLEKMREERKRDAAADGFYLKQVAPRASTAADEFELLRQCFQRLYENERELLLQYFADLPAEELAAHRQKLADREGIDLNSLRNRVSRLRRRLEECVREKK
jgi:DNA-directed RNA polymerase specialized sigma24 family protein